MLDESITQKASDDCINPGLVTPVATPSTHRREKHLKSPIIDYKLRSSSNLSANSPVYQLDFIDDTKQSVNRSVSSISRRRSAHGPMAHFAQNNGNNANGYNLDSNDNINTDCIFASTREPNLSVSRMNGGGGEHLTTTFPKQSSTSSEFAHLVGSASSIPVDL